MAYDIANAETIREMVYEFYAHILKDEMLGPIFIRVLGDDMQKGKWPEHLQRLDAFWMLMMNGFSSYQGDPTPAHAFIGQLTPESFDRWLELFESVVNEMFVPEVSEKFIKKAHIVSNQLRSNLGVDDDEDDDF